MPLNLAASTTDTDDLQHYIDCFRSFLDNLGVPIAIIDMEGRYVYYNRESAEIDGCAVEDALGKPLLSLYPYIKEDDSTMLQSLRHGRVFINHHQNYFNAKGKLINYTHTTTPLVNRSGKTIGAIEFGFDASSDIKLQQQLISLTKTLVRKTPETIPAEEKIVTQSAKMKNLIAVAKRYAVSDIPVIIYGPSGAGKELFAQLIYENSTRCHQPFIVLNCGALTESLIESSLFGTVKGAFTGAENSEGYLELANGGTLFLDEFNSMTLAVQTKLLRYLQTKQYCRVGDVRPQVSDARIIVAMNEDPLRLIQEGRLRQDLYYRLSVAMLTLPSLDERPEDFVLLANHFITKYASLSPAKITGISNPQVLYRSWPGNVRMLENEMVRNIVMHDKEGPLTLIISDITNDTVTPHAVRTTHDALEEGHRANALDSTAMVSPLVGESLTEQVEHYERALIVDALNRAGGNISEAARALGIKRTTLIYKVEKYQLSFGVTGEG